MKSILKDHYTKSSTADIAVPLTGDYRGEHLFVLQQELIPYEVYFNKYHYCWADAEIEKNV